MAIEPVTLQGRFVGLRPLGLADVPALRALAAGPRGTFEWALVPAPEQVERYVETALSQMSRRAAVVSSTSSTMVGRKSSGMSERGSASTRAICSRPSRARWAMAMPNSRQ